jgi:ribosomal protein L29
MKRKEFMKEWRGKSLDEIQKEMLQEAKTLMNLRFKAAVGQVVDVTEKRKIKERIARLKAIETEKRVEA